MSQAGIIDLIQNNPSIPIVFDGNTGSGSALFNIFRIVGDGTFVSTSVSGNTLTISLMGTAGETITGNTGGPLSPISGNWNILGAATSAGTNPVQTVGSTNTLIVNVQRSQAIASTDATKVGLAAFKSTDFTVDVNGFVSLNAAGGDFVTSVTGTSNRITSTGGTTPQIDISAAYVGQASITTLGTIATGTWNATAIAAIYGGTGITTYAVGDTLYANSTTTLARLAAGSNGQVLTLAAGIPSWATPTTGTVTSVTGTTNRITSTGGATPVIDISASYVGQASITTLGTITTGVWNGTTIAAANGGTGQSTYTTGDILYASGATTLSKLGIGTTGQVLEVSGGIPAWKTANGVTVWQTITASQTLAVNNGYICVASGGALVLPLPATSAVGDEIEVTLDGATSWKITQGTNQSIRITSITTTTTTGSLASTTQGDTVRMVCSVANLKWNVLSYEGNITYV